MGNSSNRKSFDFKSRLAGRRETSFLISSAGVVYYIGTKQISLSGNFIRSNMIS